MDLRNKEIKIFHEEIEDSIPFLKNKTILMPFLIFYFRMIKKLLLNIDSSLDMAYYTYT